MARPRVFVSSTYYDLKHIRASLGIFVKSLGFEPILSESGNIPYTPDVPLDESCYREASNSDIYVLIIGGRYGSETSEHKTSNPKSFYDFYESITKKEYQAAINAGVPIYILIERSVYSELQTFKKNRDNETVEYAHVDSANIFHFIEEILALPKNNPIEQFDRYEDIESWLREQWAGYFRELLNQRSSQEQIRSLATQVKILEGQITFLSQINETLKRYLENVMSKVSPQESDRIIQDEEDRMKRARHSVLTKYFPNLKEDDYRIISPANPEFNSAAWAAGETCRFWWPSFDDDPHYYWPNGVPREHSLESFISAFGRLGYQPCESGEHEPGFEKIAIYVDSAEHPTHVAKQLESGEWTSKLGALELVEHKNLNVLEGQPYGTVAKILKRPVRS